MAESGLYESRALRTTAEHRRRVLLRNCIDDGLDDFRHVDLKRARLSEMRATAAKIVDVQRMPCRPESRNDAGSGIGVHEAALPSPLRAAFV